MIIDTLDHAAVYRKLSLSIAEALHFLRNNQIQALAEGRFEMEGDQEYASVQSYVTRPPGEKRWEAHRKYLDLQYIIEGTEWMGYSPVRRLESVEPYDQVKDIEWFQGEGSFVLLPAGSFAILSPQDAHKPGVCLGEPSRVRKIVFKLQANAWQRGE